MQVMHELGIASKRVVQVSVHGEHAVVDRARLLVGHVHLVGNTRHRCTGFLNVAVDSCRERREDRTAVGSGLQRAGVLSGAW